MYGTFRDAQPPCSVPIGRFGHQASPAAGCRRFLLFDDKREVELVWNGKTGEVCNVVLPFQVIVTLLSSFVRRVDFHKPEVGVEYTVPVQLGSGLTVTTEVPDGGSVGSPTRPVLGTCVWARLTFPEPVPYRPKSKSGPPLRRNPIALAHEWHDLLTNDELCSKAALAREMGASRSYVTQVLHLLQLDPKIRRHILAQGDPIQSRGSGVRSLGKLTRLPPEQQMVWITKQV